MFVNSLIKLTNNGWCILGRPARSEDYEVGEIGDTIASPSVGNEDVALDRDSKDELLNMDYIEVNSLPPEATYFDTFLSLMMTRPTRHNLRGCQPARVR